MINAASCDCFLLFVQSSTCALSAKYEVDVSGISYTRDFASTVGRHSAALLSHHCSCGDSSWLLPTLSLDPWNVTLGSLLEGITYFILVINAFLIYGLNIQDKLVLCLCYTDSVFASLLLHYQRCLVGRVLSSARSFDPPCPCHPSASPGGSMSDAKTEDRGENQLKS